jgi:hypothetical protein
MLISVHSVRISLSKESRLFYTDDSIFLSDFIDSSSLRCFKEPIIVPIDLSFCYKVP